MAANLFGDRFYSLRQPAWHGLGTVSQVEEGAVDALNHVGEYNVRLVGLQTSEGQQLVQRGILRDPVDGETDPRFLGIVGPEYHLVTPREVCETWDNVVKRPIETLGALGTGDVLFLSTKLPSFNVKGDEVDNYMLLVSPMNGLEAIRIRVTPVRVVCQNTLIAAKSASSQVYKVIHDANAGTRLTKWLGSLMVISEQRTKTLQEAFNAFAEYKVTERTTEQILETTYPEPARPQFAADPETMEAREKAWEEMKTAAIRARSEVVEIYGGKGKGQDIEATLGTGWGLYNAVVEREDYLGVRDKKLEARARDVLFGLRAQTKERCYEAVENHILAEAGRASKKRARVQEVEATPAAA